MQYFFVVLVVITLSFSKYFRSDNRKKRYVYIDKCQQDMGCTVIFSIAEATLLPNLSILLDRLAPERYRGAYLGASTLAVLSLSLGPFVGGALLEWSGKGVLS